MCRWRSTETAWCVAAGGPAIFHEAGKRTGCTGAYGDLLALMMTTWLVSLALNALVKTAGTRAVQNGPRLELVQIPLKKMTTRDH